MRNFITIEGCDGVGKTYQTRALKEYCQQLGLDVVFTREPGGSDIADLSPEQAFARKGGADKTDRLEAVDCSFHTKVYQGYKSLIAAEPDKFEVIDASGSKEQTQALIRQALVRRGVLPC